MVEKDLQSIFTAWVKSHREWMLRTTVWELKMIKGTSFAFDRLAEHQIEGLCDARGIGMYHKISDTPVSWGGQMRFTSKKPMDCMLVKDADAFVVLCFYKPREKKVTIWIQIEDFMNAKLKSKKKSMRENEAKLIADRIVVM